MVTMLALAVSVDYFFHNNNHLLENSISEELNKYAKDNNFSIKTTINSVNNKINQVLVKCNITGADFSINQGSMELNDEEEKEGYWVNLYGLYDHGTKNAERIYTFLKDFSQQFGLLFDDPQSGNQNLEPEKFLEFIISEEELNKQNEQLDKEVKALRERISKESSSEFYIFSENLDSIKNELNNKWKDQLLPDVTPAGKGFMVTPVDKSRHNAEPLAESLSEIWPILYIFRYEYSSSVIFFNKGKHLAGISYDSSANVADGGTAKKRGGLETVFGITSKEIQQIIDNPGSNLEEFSDKVLTIANLK